MRHRTPPPLEAVSDNSGSWLVLWHRPDGQCVWGSGRHLRLGESRTIEGVEFRGIRQGHYLLDWYRFLSATRPDWLYHREATHLLGLLVQIAHLNGVQTIFAAAFDTDVRPRVCLNCPAALVAPLCMGTLARPNGSSSNTEDS